MKKFRFLLIVIFVFFFSGCTLQDFRSCYNAPLRKNMIEYYSKDSNYVHLVGEIETLVFSNREDSALSTGGDIKIISKGDKDFKNGRTSWFIYCGPTQGLKVGDIISFTTAPMLFYNGDHYRIVAVQKDEEVYYTFEEGKQNLLNWINETFG